MSLYLRLVIANLIISLILTSLIAVLVYMILNSNKLCNSAAIDTFIVPNPVFLNDGFVWINCSGHVGGDERLDGIELLKDRQQFYIYSANDYNINTTGIFGIDRTQIETFIDTPGCARINDRTESLIGKYRCRYWFVRDKHELLVSRERFIDTIVRENQTSTQPSTEPQTRFTTRRSTPHPTQRSTQRSTHLSTQTQTQEPITTQKPPPSFNDTKIINKFEITQPILVGTDFSVICMPSLSANQTLISRSISKDNEIFYELSNNKVKPKSVNGINIFQISYPKNTTGIVIISAANTQIKGIYKCELTVKTINGTIVSSIQTLNITVTNNNWSPVITSYDTPTVIAKDDDYWINCTYNPTTSEKLVALNLSKVFYSYNGDKPHVTEFHTSINIYSIIPLKDVGCVKIKPTIQTYKGSYRCSVTAQINGSIEGITTNEAFVDYSEVKNVYLNNLQAPSKFGKGDDLIINCSLNLESGVNLTTLTISKDDNKFYAYKSSTNNFEKFKIPEIPDTNQIRINNDHIGVVTIPYATAVLKGKYKCYANLSTPDGPLIESVEKYVDFTNEWKPNIYRFYVPDSIKRGSSYFWVNCSLKGLTEDEQSNYLLTIMKDNEIFYNISSNSIAKTYPVNGLESYQFDINGQFDGSVRIKDPTIEARGYYNCSLSTTRGVETKTVYKAYYVNKANALVISISMCFVMIIAIFLNL